LDCGPSRPNFKEEIKHGYVDIPSKHISQISGKFTTAYQLEKEIETLKQEIAALKAFRLYAAAVLGLVAVLLFPTVRDNIAKFVGSAPQTESSSSFRSAYSRHSTFISGPSATGGLKIVHHE
jgi:hypothetical protein